MIYSLDSNIISYMIRKNKSVCDRYLAESRMGNECVIPPVVYYEVKRGLLFAGATAKAHSFDSLCRDFSVGEMNPLAWDEAARLYALHRRQGTLIEDADLFTAAFCLVHGYTLVTDNTRHFERVEGLQLVNWVR